MTDVTCQVIDRASLKPLFEAKPAMAEEISHLLAQRHGELDGERDALSQRPADGTAHSKKLLGRIKAYFASIEPRFSPFHLSQALRSPMKIPAPLAYHDSGVHAFLRCCRPLDLELR